MATINETILDRVHLNSSNDYQQRVPLAVQDGVSAVYDAIQQPRYWNEFVDNLITLIGEIRVKQENWSNPLAEFKSWDFSEGKTAQEIAFPFIQALAYDQNATNFLEQHKIKPESAFYHVNRRVVYPVTVNEVMLRQSFNTPDGLGSFIAGTLNAAILSNQYDEYRFMLQTLSAANLANPFYNVNVDVSEAATAEQLKNLSLQIRLIAKKMTVAPSGNYNAYGVPTVSNKEDLVLITTPEITAALDVTVLADAFNVDRADFANRVIEVDELPWAGAHAVLLDKRAIVAGDTLLTIESMRNPRSLTTNYYLHAHGAYAISPMHNAVVFSDQPGSQLGVIDFELTGIEANFAKEVNFTPKAVDSVIAGTSDVRLIVEAQGDVTGDDKDVFRVPGTWTAEIESNEDIDSRTYVDQQGYLHVAGDVPVGTVLNVTVRSSYVDPSAPLTEQTVDVSTEVSITVDSRVNFIEDEAAEEPAA